MASTEGHLRLVLTDEGAGNDVVRYETDDDVAQAMARGWVRDECGWHNAQGKREGRQGFVLLVQRKRRAGRQGVAGLAERNTSCHVRVFPHLLKLSPGYFWPFRPLSLASPRLASARRPSRGSRNIQRHDSRRDSKGQRSPHRVPLLSLSRADYNGISAVYDYRWMFPNHFSNWSVDMQYLFIYLCISG